MYWTIAVNSALRAAFNCLITFSSPRMVLPPYLPILRGRGQRCCDAAHREVVMGTSIGMRGQLQGRDFPREPRSRDSTFAHCTPRSIARSGVLCLGAYVELWVRDAHQPLLEPAHDVIEALDAVPGLSRAREFVGLAREHDDRRRALQIFQGAKQLFAAGIWGGAGVGFAQHEEYRRVDVFHEGDGGAVGVVLGIFKRRRFEPTRLEECEIGGVPP